MFIAIFRNCICNDSTFDMCKQQDTDEGCVKLRGFIVVILQKWADHSTERKEWRRRTLDSTKEGLEDSFFFCREINRMLSHIPCEFDSTPDELEAVLPMSILTGGKPP